MKKILAIAMALVLAMALSVSVFADDVLYSHDFTDNHPDAWWEEASVNGLSNDADLIAALKTPGAKLVIEADEAVNVEATDWGWQYGIVSTATSPWTQVMMHYNFDGTKNPEKGNEGDVGAESVVVENGHAFITIDAATLLAACDSLGLDLSAYNWVNGAGNSGSANTYGLKVIVPSAEAEPEATETETTEPETTEAAPETTETTTETTTEETASAPSTGLALAVVPAVVALAAAVVSKKR